jgi:hypothetical protein
LCYNAEALWQKLKRRKEDVMLKRFVRWMCSSVGLRWLAVSVLLLAFILVSWGYIPGNGIWYQVINMAGSSLMIASCLIMKPKDWAVATFNMVWILVALLALAHIIRLF